MARLTLQQQHELRVIVGGLEWARDFIHQPDIAVARKLRPEAATTTLHYVRSDGCLYEIAKDIGSPLVGLDTNLQRLQEFLKHYS